MKSETWTFRGRERDWPMMGESFDPRINEDHECFNCGAPFRCERPTWDDCGCPIYCGACEEARQETPGP